jgi:putative DNA primase/helicase
MMKLKFSPAAYRLFNEWLDKNQNIVDDADTRSALQSHFIKYEALVPKIACIFHVLDSRASDVTNCIEADICKRAITFVEYLRTHAYRLYGMGVQPEITNAQTILKRFNKLDDGFTLRDVRRKSWTGLSKNSDIERALNMLVDHGYLRQQVRTPQSGRPTANYTKHPEYRLTKPTKPLSGEK